MGIRDCFAFCPKRQLLSSASTRGTPMSVANFVNECWMFIPESWTANVSVTMIWLNLPNTDQCSEVWREVTRLYKQCGDSPLTITLLLSLITILFTLCKWFQKGRTEKVLKSPEVRQMSDVSSWSVFDMAKTAYQPGHTEALMSLVDQYRYDVNYIIPATGLSLFLCTCLSGEKAAIKFMIKKGADVNTTSKDGDTPLYLATFGILNTPTPDVSVIMELIEAGCDVNKPNFRGYTPLHRAASKGNIPIIKCLLVYGADPYQATKAGVLPISNAINAGNLHAAEYLQIHVDNPHVWDVVDPHTPPRIQLGLQSPRRKHLVESSRPTRALSILT